MCIDIHTDFRCTWKCWIPVGHGSVRWSLSGKTGWQPKNTRIKSCLVFFFQLKLLTIFLLRTKTNENHEHEHLTLCLTTWQLHVNFKFRLAFSFALYKHCSALDTDVFETWFGAGVCNAMFHRTSIEHFRVKCDWSTYIYIYIYLWLTRKCCLLVWDGSGRCLPSFDFLWKLLHMSAAPCSVQQHFWMKSECFLYFCKVVKASIEHFWVHTLHYFIFICFPYL